MTYVSTAPYGAPSFPPVDDALTALRSIDWDQQRLNAQRALNSAAAFVVVAFAVVQALAQRIAPYAARTLRSAANRIDALGTTHEIRRMATAGASQRAIAAALGVSRHLVRQTLAA